MKEEGCKEIETEGRSEQALCIDTPLRTNREQAPYPVKASGTQSDMIQLKNMFLAHMKTNPGYFLSVFTYLSRRCLQLLPLH